ncbi:uncharacterized protein ciita [Pholidichthys leucotaenia]
MAQFEEGLREVRMALTSASSAEIRALLQGLVKPKIIPEAYSKTVNLHGLTGWRKSDQLCREPACQWSLSKLDKEYFPLEMTSHQFSQVRKDVSRSAAGGPKLLGHDSMRSGPQMNRLCEHEVFYRNALTQKLVEDNAIGQQISQRVLSTPVIFDHSLGLNDENTEQLRGADLAQKLLSDNERENDGKVLPLVPCVSVDGSTSEKMTDGEAQSAALGLEEEMELAAATLALEISAEDFKGTDLEVLEAVGDSDAPGGLPFPIHSKVEKAELSTGCRSTFVVETIAAADGNDNITDELESPLGGSWTPERTTDELFYFRPDRQCQATSGYSEENFAHLLTSFSQNDTQPVIRDVLFYSGDKVTEKKYRTTTCCTDGGSGIRENLHSHWDIKMLEGNQDPLSDMELGLELPDDLTEFMVENYLEPNVFLDDLSTIDIEEFSTPICDIAVAAVEPSLNSQQRQKSQLTSTRKTWRKRQRVQRPSKEKSRAKRLRATGEPPTSEEQAEPEVHDGTGTGSEPSPEETIKAVSTTQTRVLYLYPSHSASPNPIQLIPIPDNMGYQVVQLHPPPPVIRLPLPNRAATPIILVPASPPYKHPMPPLSPADGAVVPFQMNSSPPGSLSDTASKAMSPMCALPCSPSNEMLPHKESPLPHSSTVIDIPQVVKDYIQEAKTYMSQACQDMEVGLNLASHYVDVRVSQRETLRSGKTTNRSLEKEMVTTGYTDRQKSLLKLNQIFEASNGHIPKRYILLLGNAGMGKTTLIKKLCVDWSTDHIPQFDFLFLLDGRQLNLTEPTYSLQTLLLKSSSFAPSCSDSEAVFTQVLAAPKRVLIIFDGFDELREYESLLQTQEKDLITSLQRDNKAQSFTMRQLYSAILQRNLLQGSTLLLSTRPRGTASQLLRRTDALLEVCGFTPENVDTYLYQYFPNPDLRASAVDRLKNTSYLNLLCWNPGLCRLVCLILEQSPDVLPRTLTGLCHQVLCLKMEKDSGRSQLQGEAQKDSLKETVTRTSKNSQVSQCHKNNQTKSKGRVRTSARSQRVGRAKEEERQTHNVDEEMDHASGEMDRLADRELVSQLSSLAWDGVKANSSTLPTTQAVSAELETFGLRTGLFLAHDLRIASKSKEELRGKEDKNGTAGGEKRKRREDTGKTNADVVHNDHILFWASPFLQCYMAAIHLSLSRTVSDRSFLQTLPFHTGTKGRRRSQREELELTLRFAVGLLFHNRTELQRLLPNSEMVFREVVVSKQASVTKQLEGLSYRDLSPTQILEACHHVYEASFTCEDGGRDSGSTRLMTHLAENLPENLTFRGVSLSPNDVFTVQKALRQGEGEGRSFSLDLEDSGIQMCGLRALVDLSNISTYRACIADVIALWEQLEQSGEEELLQSAVSKFKIHPLKATQVCHIEHLEKLVNIHMRRRLSDSTSQSNSTLAEGVPAVKELHKLELELGPDNGPLALPKLWEFLPGLHNLQHLDLENSKIGDKGAEKLSHALVALSSLEVLNLSQNCIGDQGVKTLAVAMKNLPKLHCLSLYSNVISDEGAESLAAVLPHMATLADVDVKYNKFTDVGAQSLGASLRNCKKIKTLRMWNQCIPYGVFERLQHQDSRILWH